MIIEKTGNSLYFHKNIKSLVWFQLYWLMFYGVLRDLVGVPGYVAYVLDCVKGTTSKIANIRAYLRTSLFNAPDSMKIYYHNWAMHDMEQGAQKQKQETKRHEQHENNAPTAGTKGG